MAWIESHQEIARHPKTRRLMQALGINRREAVGLVHCLWWWALDQAPDGDLSDAGPYGAAEATFWEGNEQQLWDALVSSGWLTVDGKIHDHDDYREKYERQKRLAAERQARKRSRDTGVTADDVTPSHADVTRDSPVTHGADRDREKDNDERESLSPRDPRSDSTASTAGRPFREIPTGGAPPARPGPRLEPTPLRPEQRTPHRDPRAGDDVRPIEERTPPWAANAPPGDAGEALLATTRRREALFDAYADELKLAKGSAERRQRQTRAAALLADPASAALTAERVRVLTRYTVARRRQTGYVPTPDLEHVLCEASAHDAWQAAGGLTDEAGGPVLPRAPTRASPQPAATSTAQDGGLAEWRRAQDAERRGSMPAAPGSG